jgi:hypothetical protein
MLLPRRTIEPGTAKHHSLIGEVQNAYLPILAQASRIGNGNGTFGSSHTRLTAWVKAPFCQRPEMFGGLQFGGVGREEVQIDVVGYTQAQTGVPSSTIQHDPAQSSSWG